MCKAISLLSLFLSLPLKAGSYSSCCPQQEFPSFSQVEHRDYSHISLPGPKTLNSFWPSIFFWPSTFLIVFTLLLKSYIYIYLHSRCWNLTVQLIPTISYSMWTEVNYSALIFALVKQELHYLLKIETYVRCSISA